MIKFAPLLALLLLLGCKAITGEPETDVLALVDQKLWEANAPRIELVFDVDNARGVTSPAVSVIAKQKIPLTVSFTPTNTAWAFTEWSASAEIGGELRSLSPLDIYFESIAEPVTQLIVLSGGFSRIIIKPVLAERPRVWDSHPSGGFDNPADLNAPVTVRFTSDIQDEPFIFGFQAGNPVFRNGTGAAAEFKNITIQGTAPFWNGEPRNYVQYFKDPVIRGNTLKLETDPDNRIPTNSYITVTINGAGSGIAREGTSVYDFIPVAEPVVIRYAVRDTFNIRGPEILYFGASGNGLDTLPSGTEVNPGETIYLILSAYDEISLTDLGLITITEQKPDGTPLSELAFEDLYQEDLLKASWQRLINNIRESYEGSLPGIYIFSYTLTSVSGAGGYAYTGPVDIHVSVKDAQGYSSDPLATAANFRVNRVIAP